MPDAACCGSSTRRTQPLAVKAFAQIDEEAGGRWPSVRLAIHHRTGRVAIGEASVAIAAASPHRAEAFAACRYAIERIKQIAPIWKHEHFEGATSGSKGDRRSARRRRAADRIRARMFVTIHLFARLREIAGAAELSRNLPDGATARTAWDALVSDFPAMGDYAAAVSCAVNEEYARMTTPLNDGDDVAFLRRSPLTDCAERLHA